MGADPIIAAEKEKKAQDDVDEAKTGIRTPADPVAATDGDPASSASHSGT